MFLRPCSETTGPVLAGLEASSCGCLPILSVLGLYWTYSLAIWHCTLFDIVPATLSHPSFSSHTQSLSPIWAKSGASSVKSLIKYNSCPPPTFSLILIFKYALVVILSPGKGGVYSVCKISYYFIYFECVWVYRGAYTLCVEWSELGIKLRLAGPTRQVPSPPEPPHWPLSL